MSFLTVQTPLTFLNSLSATNSLTFLTFLSATTSLTLLTALTFLTSLTAPTPTLELGLHFDEIAVLRAPPCLLHGLGRAVPHFLEAVEFGRQEVADAAPMRIVGEVDVEDRLRILQEADPQIRHCDAVVSPES